MSSVCVPGERLSVGPGYRWIVYGQDTAALYLTNRGLVRQDERGWWYCGVRGRRMGLEPVELLFVAGTAPGGWRVLAEQEPLLDAHGLAQKVVGHTTARRS